MMGRGSMDYLSDPVLVGALGPFDTDPCCPRRMPWRTAATMICRPADGLKVQWRGRVWLNPPFGNPEPWLQRMVVHGNGIALLPARTDTGFFQACVLADAWSVLFIRQRLRFFLPSGNPAAGKYPGGLALVAYSRSDAELLESRPPVGGYLMRLRYAPGSRPRRSGFWLPEES